VGFQKRSIRGRIYQAFIPPTYVPNRPWPLVVFLHGVGENGTDGEKHLAVGLPPYIRSNEQTFPAFVLAPQCKGPWKYVGEDEDLILDAVTAAQREWRIDPRRIYLTGISQGGCSTFDLGARYPDRWAGLVVVCGAGMPSDAGRIAAPMWIFHGERDEVVPPSGPHQWDSSNVGGRDMARLIPRATYTEYPDADHFIWDRVYADPAMWEWLLAQKR
jgi:predicted peptidase